MVEELKVVPMMFATVTLVVIPVNCIPNTETVVKGLNTRVVVVGNAILIVVTAVLSAVDVDTVGIIMVAVAVVVVGDHEIEVSVEVKVLVE